LLATRFLCCSELQCVVMCCSVLHIYRAEHLLKLLATRFLCCSVLQCVVMCCSVLQETRLFGDCVNMCGSVFRENCQGRGPKFPPWRTTVLNLEFKP
jgi:hypothetical protein